MYMIDRIKAVIKKHMDAGTIEQAAGVSLNLSSDMRTELECWSDIYKNDPPWVKKEGENDLRKLNLGAGIAREFARLVTVEMQIRINGESEKAHWMAEIMEGIPAQLRSHVEKACAKGGMVIRPYLSGDQVCIDYIDAEYFFPTACDSSGRITGGIIVSKKQLGKQIYTKLEMRNFKDGTETVQNKAFVSADTHTVGKPCALGAVSEWADLPESFSVTGITEPLFTYFKMPFPNNVDEESPLGISVYANAVDLLEDADKQYSTLLWEYDGGALAIDADVTALPGDYETGWKLPKRSKRLFRQFDGLKGDGTPFYNVFSPDLRDERYLAGLNSIFKRIEFNCSLAYGTLSDPNNVDKTAEEIRSSKQRSYSAVCDIQKQLEDALRHTAYCISTWAQIGGLCPEGAWEAAFSWDDSIIADRQAEFSERMQLQSAGVIQAWENRMWYLGEDAETAKSAIADTTEEYEE